MLGVTTHRTTPEAAQSIREEGFRVERAEPDARFGRGFYSSTRPQPEFGTASVSVAVRLVNPLGPLPLLDIEDAILALQMEFGTVDIREVLLEAGYDGVIVRWGPGDDEVVACHDEQVKVVRDGRPRR